MGAHFDVQVRAITWLWPSHVMITRCTNKLESRCSWFHICRRHQRCRRECIGCGHKDKVFLEMCQHFVWNNQTAMGNNNSFKSLKHYWSIRSTFKCGSLGSFDWCCCCCWWWWWSWWSCCCCCNWSWGCPIAVSLSGTGRMPRGILIPLAEVKYEKWRFNEVGTQQSETWRCQKSLTVPCSVSSFVKLGRTARWSKLTKGKKWSPLRRPEWTPVPAPQEAFLYKRIPNVTATKRLGRQYMHLMSPKRRAGPC